jgi:Polyketide cyclase / dehydrase and lipid transport
MWKSEHSADVHAAASDVWPWYADAANWPKWYPDLKMVVLDGPFEAGVTGVLEQDPESGHHMEPVRFTVTEVTENESWTLDLMAPTDETGIVDEIQMRSRARLETRPEGGLRIVHWAELSGPGTDEIGEAIGPWISESLAKGVAKLAELVTA